MIFTEENALPNWFCHFNHACKELAILFWQMFHWLHLFMKYTPSRLSSLNGISALFQALLCHKGGVSRHSECKDYAPPPPRCKSPLYAWKHLCVRLHLYSSPCVIQYSDSQWTTESSGAPLLFFFSWLLYQSCNYSLGCRKVSNAGTTVCEKFIAEIVKNVTRNFLFRPISCRGLVMCVLDLGQHVGLEKQWGISSWLEFTATQLWLRPRRGKP